MNSSRETVFHFKQFDVVNSQSAMKVGTDGVLLGCWCPLPNDDGLILDLGCGTGLLTLMLAQRCKNRILGIDIDPIACFEAQRNVANSKWSDRIEIINRDFNEFVNDGDCGRYSLIVCNPPYFMNGVRSQDKKRDLARFTSSLSFVNVIQLGSKLLSENGVLAMVTPYEYKSDIIYYAELNKLSFMQMTEVSTKEGKTPKRLLSAMSKIALSPKKSRLSIMDKDGGYDRDYVELTRDYYLNF